MSTGVKLVVHTGQSVIHDKWQDEFMYQYEPGLVVEISSSEVLWGMYEGMFVGFVSNNIVNTVSK